MHTQSFDHGLGEKLVNFDSGGFDSVRIFRSRVRSGMGRLSRRAIPSDMFDATTIVATTRKLRVGSIQTRDIALLTKLEAIR